MTYDDFQAQVDTIFERIPLVPVVLELTSGGRAIVDMPEQIEMQPDAVTIRRKTERKPQRTRFADIARIVALDELPGEEGGLSYAEFYRVVRPLLYREPYQPFAFELRDGTRIWITSPNRLSMAGRFCVFLPPDSKPLVHFRYDEVSRIIPVESAQAG